MGQMVLLRNARPLLADPAALRGGVVDILVAGGSIVALEPRLDTGGLDVFELDLEGRYALPGLVDGHVHFLGAAGDEGLSSKTPEIFLGSFMRGGVTTAVGCLGFGRGNESLKHLWIKAQTLAAEGLSTYMYTGNFETPSPSITGSPAEDIVLVPQVRGVKTTIADSCSSHPSVEEMARLASESYIAGLQSGKPGMLHVHVGHHGDPYFFLEKVREHSGVPSKQLVPTHCNWSDDLVEGAVEYALRGGYVDFSTILDTARGSKTSVKAGRAVRRMLDGGAPLERITLSTDGNVGMPIRNAEGEQTGLYLERVSSLWDEIRDLIADGMPPGDAVALGSRSPAQRLGLFPRKGFLGKGSDADIVVLGDKWEIEYVYLGGRLGLDRGEPVIRSLFEADILADGRRGGE